MCTFWCANTIDKMHLCQKSPTGKERLPSLLRQPQCCGSIVQMAAAATGVLRVCSNPIGPIPAAPHVEFLLRWQVCCVDVVGGLNLTMSRLPGEGGAAAGTGGQDILSDSPVEAAVCVLSLHSLQTRNSYRLAFFVIINHANHSRHIRSTGLFLLRHPIIEEAAADVIPSNPKKYRWFKRSHLQLITRNN